MRQLNIGCNIVLILDVNRDTIEENWQDVNKICKQVHGTASNVTFMTFIIPLWLHMSIINFVICQQ